MDVTDRRDGHARKNVEAKRARQRQHKHENARDRGSTATGDAPLVDRPADEVLEHGNHRRKRGEAHEHEEQRAPHVAQRHLPKHHRQRHEHKRRPLVRTYTVGKACREDDKARQDGNDGVERGHRDGLAGEAALAPDVGPEDLHRGHAERKREERLPHSGEHRIAERRPLLRWRHAREQAREVGHKVKRDPLPRAWQRHRAHAQHEHNHEQRRHHPLGDTLDALLQAHAAHNRTDHDRHHHPRDKPHRVGEHAREHGRCRLDVRPVEHARRHLRHIGEHPAAHGGVKHHEHRAANVAPPGEPVPRARRLQPVECLRRRLLRRAPDRKLHHHDRQP